MNFTPNELIFPLFWIIIDQSAVRAASQGRILILEGIEKAERNVLPVLNNLLENREMVCTKNGFFVKYTM